MKQTSKETRSLPFFGVGKLLPYLRPYRAVLCAMIVCGLCGSAVDVALPLFQRYALNHFVKEGTLDTLPLYIVLYTAAVLLAGATNYVACSRAMQVEVSVNRDLRNAAFNHLQTLSFSYFNQNSVGYIHARLMSDTSRIGSLVSWSLMDSVWHLSYLVGAVAVMLAVNARLALLVMTILPLIVLLILSTFVGALIVPPLQGVLPQTTELAHGSMLTLEITSGVVAVVGILLAAWLWLGKRTLVTSIANSAPGRLLGTWWYNAWGFDWLYDKVFVKPFLGIAWLLKRDPLNSMMNIPAVLSRFAGKGLLLSENGYLRWYVASMSIGAVVVLALLMVLR